MTFSFGPFTLDPAKRLLTRDSEPIALTPKAFDTLRLLVEERATALSKDVLLSRIWPDVSVEESNLAQIIFTLRRALGDDPLHPAFIATVPRHGYRFVADVVEHAEADGSPTKATRWRIVAATLAAVVLVAVAFAFVISQRAATSGASNLTVFRRYRAGGAATTSTAQAGGLRLLPAGT